MSDRFPDAGGGEGSGSRSDERRMTDPTALTIDRVLREIGLLNARFALQISSLSELIDERFKAVDLQFALVERQRIEQKQDTKTAVDAALQAQKEAVREQTSASDRAIAKSEASFVSQINALGTTVQTAIVGITTTLDDTKERISRIESHTAGGKDAQVDMRAIIGLVMTAIIIAIGIYASRH